MLPGRIVSMPASKLRLYYEATRRDRLSGDYSKLWRQVSRRDDKRVAFVRHLLEQQRIKRASDLYRAAYILHHSADPRDHAAASLLALEAVRRGLRRSVDGLSPNSLGQAARDRFLVNIGLPQRYGTQFSISG